MIVLIYFIQIYNRNKFQVWTLQTLSIHSKEVLTYLFILFFNVILILETFYTSSVYRVYLKQFRLK